MPTSRTKGFHAKTIYKFRKPKLLKHAKERLSFTVAAFSVCTFIMGNMVGQHGWYAFWKTVVGEESDALIVFEGFVPPVRSIPDYKKWSAYGGNTDEHTFAMVPRDVLVPLPTYNPSALRNREGKTYDSMSLAELVYSMGNKSSYATGNDDEGSHTGVDVRTPVGTPILSVGVGVVQKVVVQEYGFGHYIVVRYPNVPDSTASDGTSTYYATYAHLDAILVREGQVVKKGEQIGTSGDTGFASGPHLHFQIDTEEAPYHPYWPFTSGEAAEKGMTFTQAVNAGLHQERASLYTVSPMLLVQSFTNYTAPQFASAAVQGVVAQQATSAKSLTPAERLKLRSSARASSRQSRADVRASRRVAIQPAVTTTVTSPAVTETVATDSGVGGTSQDVYRIELTHDGIIGRTSKKATLRAVDRDGNLVQSPIFTGKLYLRSEFGEADIRPSELTSANFINGEATVSVTGKSQKTVVLVTRGAFETTSAPMVYAR